MSFAFPLILILLAPLAVAGWSVAKGGLAGSGRLPGAWNTLVSPALKQYLAVRAQANQRLTPFLCLALAAIIILVLARPGGENTAGPDLRGLAGRVIVLDASTDTSRQAVFIREMEDAAPDLPTAIVAVADDAYLIVPFTTDPVQTHRYLNVLTPDMIPGEGRRLHLGIAAAERAILRAGYPLGQVILTTDLAPPQPIAIAPSKTQRTIAALGENPADWRDFADLYGAEVINGGDAADASTELLAQAQAEAEATQPGARFDLSPWLIGATMLGWLALFRRRDT